MRLIIKRILAFLVDCLIILLYAGLLFLITTALFPISETNSDITYNPVQGQLIGFFSLTLPVFLYSFLFENSKLRATPGKMIQKLAVFPSGNTKSKCILKRNLLKYLPWEIAHTGIHWMFYYNSNSLEIPVWVWILLILPQIVVIAFILSLFLLNGNQSLYDRFAKTKVLKAQV